MVERWGKVGEKRDIFGEWENIRDVRRERGEEGRRRE